MKKGKGNEKKIGMKVSAGKAGRFSWAVRAMFLAFFLVFLAGCGNAPEKSREGARTVQTGKAAPEGTLEVHYLDVGQGDATLIRQGDHAMLIDGGDNDKGTAVQSYLQAQGILHLDYVIGTHPDSDHVGGLDVVLYKFDWDKVIMPDLEKDTKTYQDVLKVIKDKNQKITKPQAGDNYKLGEASFTVIAPVKDDYGENWNDYSVGILLSFGENRFIFTGDAEEEAEKDMLGLGMDLSADVMKAAHHGSDTANTEAFLEEVKPQFVVISCGEGNSYGHPRAEAMNNFRAVKAKVYRTDEQGTIVASSDGSNITWNCSPSESWKAGEPMGGQGTNGKSKAKEEQKGESADQTAQEEGEIKKAQAGNYILNTNTKKFHLPSCGSVDQIDKSNRETSGLERETLIENGYEPCKRCHP